MTGTPLRILITNDDGIDAPGIEIMRAIAAELSDDVWVVAPDGNQSGVGHRFTFGRELSFIQHDKNSYAIKGGSPADCIAAGCTYLLKDHKPDLILSGVNNGQNLGDILHCSGTAAGAREGAMQNVLSIAMSQAVDYEHSRDIEWDNARTFGAQLVRKIMALHAGRDTYYSVNFPIGQPADVSGIRVVPHQRFSISPFRYYPSDNPGKFFIAIPETPLPLDPDADFHVLHHDKAITVTPLSLLQTDTPTASRLDGTLTLDRPVSP